MRLLVLDNEAVQALAQVTHGKHRTVVAHVAGVVARRRRGSTATAVVPTAVCAAAGWDRSEPRAVAIDRFRIADHALDTPTANIAAGIGTRSGSPYRRPHRRRGGFHRRRRDRGAHERPGGIRRASAPEAVTVIRV